MWKVRKKNKIYLGRGTETKTKFAELVKRNTRNTKIFHSIGNWPVVEFLAAEPTIPKNQMFFFVCLYGWAALAKYNYLTKTLNAPVVVLAIFFLNFPFMVSIEYRMLTIRQKQNTHTPALNESRVKFQRISVSLFWLNNIWF